MSSTGFGGGATSVNDGVLIPVSSTSSNMSNDGFDISDTLLSDELEVEQVVR